MSYRFCSTALLAPFLLTSCFLLFSTSLAHAQQAGDGEFLDRELDRPGDEADGGFDGKLATSASASLTSNRQVVGEVDGFSALLGLSLDGALGYVDGAHAWKNSLTIDESWSRTPSLERFVKSNDRAEIESLYTYFLRDWFGPFGRAAVETHAFDTYRVTAEPTDYEVTGPGGGTELLEQREELLLSNSFEPLTVNESVGVFAQPVRDDEFTWTSRLGFGGRQTYAEGVLAVDDDEETDRVEVTELDDVFQGGLEGFSGVTGEFDDRDLSYRVGATALLPVVNNDDTDQTVFELMRWGATAGVTLGLNEYLDLNYDVSFLRDPQFVDATQVQNNLLLTFSHTLLESPSAEPSPAEKTKQAEKLRKEAADLEKKADELDEETKEEESARGDND